VRSLREAWDAAIAGVDVAERARSRPELAAALEAFRK
jgi:ribulose 1,5-bisphosphate carboxylase large subunit-like protein